MARVMFGEDPEVFRAVITTTYEANPAARSEWDRVERTSTHYAGPYGAKAPATAAVRKALRDADAANDHYRRYPDRGSLRTVVAYVERAPLNWERVE